MRKISKAGFSVSLVVVLVISMLAISVPTLAKKNQSSSQSVADWVQDEILIKAKPGKSTDNILEKIGGTVIQTHDKSGVQRVKLPNQNVEEAVEQARSDSDIEFAELNYLNKMDFVPNDQYWNEQWGWHLDKVNAAQAWDISQGNDAIIIAIIDTGIDPNHPDLKDKIVKPFNSVSGSTDLASVKDDVGHGTHVAGIAGAKLNNQIGIAGLGGNAKIMPVKAGNVNGLSVFDVASAIYYAVDNGARVINMSFGSYFSSECEKRAVDYAEQHNVVQVAAAGDDSYHFAHYPSGYDGVITVAATNQADAKGGGTNWGSIDVSAPGENIVSTTPTYQNQYPQNYASMTGTSMASPAVAGLAALVLSKNPALTNTQVCDLIYKNSHDLQDPGWDQDFGYGRIDAYRTLLATSYNLDNTGVMYQGHVQNIGWQNWVHDSDVAGTTGQSYRLEGLKVELVNAVNAPKGLRVKYQAHVQNIGWQDWVYDGNLAGTQGQSLRLEAIRAELEGPGAENYRLVYQAHVENIGWQPWVSNGQIAGTTGQSLRLEALRIKVEKK